MQWRKGAFSLTLTILLVLIVAWDIALQLRSEKATTWNFLYNVGYATFFLAGAVFGLLAAKSAAEEKRFGWLLPLIALIGLGVFLGILLSSDARKAASGGELTYPENADIAFILANILVGAWLARRLSGTTTLSNALAFASLGLLAWGLGLLVWAFYNLVLHVDIPYPSRADGYFVLMYPFFLAATWYFAKLFRPFLRPRHLIESLLILAIVGLVTVRIYQPTTADVPPAQIFFTFAYTIGDILILTAALIVLRISGGRIRSGIGIFAAGMILQTIGDYLYTYRTNVGTYWNGDIADLSYTIAAFVMSMGLSAIARGSFAALPRESGEAAVAP